MHGITNGTNLYIAMCLGMYVPWLTSIQISSSRIPTLYKLHIQKLVKLGCEVYVTVTCHIKITLIVGFNISIHSFNLSVIKS